MKVLAPDVRVSEGALTQIVIRAAEEIEGVRVRRPRRKVSIEIEGGRARVAIELAVEYGKVLPEVAREVQHEVAAALSSMCGVGVDAVDVSVEELVS